MYNHIDAIFQSSIIKKPGLSFCEMKPKFNNVWPLSFSGFRKDEIAHPYGYSSVLSYKGSKIEFTKS